MAAQILLRSTVNSQLSRKKKYSKVTSEAIIIKLTQQDLKVIGYDDDLNKEIELQNKHFIKGPSFSKAVKSSAIQFCRQCLRSNMSCLFVDNDSYFTVWLQQVNT